MGKTHAAVAMVAALAAWGTQISVLKRQGEDDDPACRPRTGAARLASNVTTEAFPLRDQHAWVAR
ncbi:hypothetical protein [Sorangium sp. So ce1024]|uniref:hypothetical protein n=1 Tax=unclassified Sorangium TaxID=2621164 RepID=UPI003F0A4DC7